ncbi:MAG: hypothetical protein RLZZ126_896 [Pseudomonadota bacterium]|jgi:protein-S-isoprenylcysteine O-methyltransferase Ste14
MLDHKIPPPLVALLVAAGMWFVARVPPEMPVAAWARWSLGAAFLLVGLSFDLRGLLEFRSARTTVNPLRPQRASHLVTGGVYQTTRNPMYVGMALILTAWAVFLAAPVSLLGPAVFVGYITRFQIQPEERALQQLFGDEFRVYCDKVPRWL